ncbi:Thioredoxin-like protein [Fulvia fulva]|uniref:Thioredoxin-like protein n=1 Tax=Passalora fulva TaxID=5499 RepID=A0A9Q8LI40_PASFU|nr:Thioredoxin-like protein [Fulvia fulva]KAK4624736.1 Thioredoxin-like protein [Fulvia fulva]KAK4625376.1 Thioredoxin-like protein [Fulvia fulva]UJO17559.1 Thioredoxin-like protein [Fulvia fulva]WPV15129.1 Thioredoxin-like protein [Fulvia fulva]WPV30536.1 Thioredoxin-like protein [Fulvia fulva]
MSSKVISITSQAHFKSIVASSTYVVVDFYADWCGPCKQISPIFEQLAAQEAKPGRLAFVKVNVDNQRDVAATYGISAMPTFLVLKGTKVVETVRGANPNALRSAILSAAADAAKGPAKQSAAFGGSGQKLGGESSASGGRTLGSGAGAGAGGGLQMPNVNFGQLFSAPASFAQGRGLPAQIVRFLGLYISTLFSFDPLRTAQESPFAVQGRTNVKTR